MIYKFTCPKCGLKHSLDIPISEYSPTGHKCTNPDCNGELVRDIEDFAGGVIWKCDGAYGKNN